MEREEPVYRMFTDILSRFIIRDTIRTSPDHELHTPSSVKYATQNCLDETKAEIEAETVETTKPKVTFKDEQQKPSNVKSEKFDLCIFVFCQVMMMRDWCIFPYLVSTEVRGLTDEYTFVVSLRYKTVFV